MKEKIKNILLTISLVYSIVIIILMIISTTNIVTNVELNDSEENINKLKEYKQQVTLLTENECTNKIKEIINYYEDTSYNGNVSIKEMYEYDFDNGLLNYYVKIKESCNITNELEKEYNLPSKFVTASIQREELYQRYYFQYELAFTDFYMRDIAGAEMTNIEYTNNRQIILEIISNLIEISNKEVIINE